MLCLLYQDDRERAQTLCSIADSCFESDTRLMVFASPAACETARAAVRQQGDVLLSRLCFYALDSFAEGARNGQYRQGALEVIRAALLESSSAAGGPLVAWVESPLPRNGAATGAALGAHLAALEALAEGTPATVISAWRLAEVPEGALRSLAEGPHVLISARMLVPCCPAWLISRVRTGFTPATGVPTHTADPLFTPLFQGEKLAALGQLAAGVAHELGNPLSIISSSLQYLHQRLADAADPASDFTMTALQNVERMHGLLRSMLDFAGVKKPHLMPIDLKEAVAEVLRFTSAECARRGVAVEVSFDPSLPRAWADPCGVKQIVLNLVKNALDAMAQAGDALRLRTRSGSNRTAVVEVEDNGPAIPADVMAQVFRPFHTTKEGGTGLGLYLSRQIARDHGGDLEAENLASGVRFTLTLPLDRRKGEGEGDGAHPDRR